MCNTLDITFRATPRSSSRFTSLQRRRHQHRDMELIMSQRHRTGLAQESSLNGQMQQMRRGIGRWHAYAKFSRCTPRLICQTHGWRSSVMLLNKDGGVYLWSSGKGIHGHVSFVVSLEPLLNPSSTGQQSLRRCLEFGLQCEGCDITSHCIPSCYQWTIETSYGARCRRTTWCCALLQTCNDISSQCGTSQAHAMFSATTSVGHNIHQRRKFEGCSSTTRRRQMPTGW